MWQTRRIVIALLIVMATALVAAVDASAPVGTAQEGRPFGDDFNGRFFWYGDDYNGIDVFPRTERVSNVGATLEPNESAPCGPIGATLWFEWQADRSGTLSLSTEGSSIPTVLAVYTFDWTGAIIPSPPGAQLKSLACDAGTSGTDAEAAVSLQVSPYTTYLIQVGGLNGAQGDIVLHGECECAPPNDTWTYPRYLSVDPSLPEVRTTVDTTRATTEPTEDTSCGNMGGTVWFVTYAPTADRVDFDVTESDFAAAVAVYQIDYSVPADTPWGGMVRRVGCGANGTLSLDLDDGYEYLVQAGGVDGARGKLVLELRCNPNCPPYNDNIGGAEWIEPPALYVVNTAGATNEPDEPQPCGGIDNSVWYLLTARGDTRINISTREGTTIRAALAVHEVTGFSPPGGNFDLVACDAAQSTSDPASISFEAEANIGYYFQVGGVDGASGQIEFEVTCEPEPCPPWNDSISQPMGMGIPADTQRSIVISEHDTRGATLEQDEPTTCGNMSRTTWYSVENYGDVPPIGLHLTTTDSDFETAIAVYAAPLDAFPPDFSALTPVECSAGAAGVRADARFTLQPNTRAWIQIGGRNGAGGLLTVGIACDPFCPPSNDNSASAWNVYGGETIDVDTRGATLEAGEPAACGPVSHTVWLRTAIGAPFALSIDASESDYDPVIAVYAIEGLSPPGGATQNVACGTGSVSFEGREGVAYMVQIGDAAGGAGGHLIARLACDGAGCSQFTGGGQGGGGVIAAPDTGSGGQAAHRP